MSLTFVSAILALAFAVPVAKGQSTNLPEVAPVPAPVPTTLADPRATVAARALVSRFVADYGRHSWSGLQLTQDLAFIYTNTSRKPVIISGDFMDYSPSRIAHGAKPHLTTEDMVALGQSGHVVAMCWHWNAPTNLLDTPAQRWSSGFMTKATTYDVAAALAGTNSPEYAGLIRDMDAIAAQLQKFSDANIPVLWRPLHEADGKWFWWGAKGSEAFKQLWRLLYHRLTVEHRLHNLIWVYTPANPTRIDWYPGDDAVDIVGLDAYPKIPGDTLVSKWQELQSRYGGRKLVALTEFGGVPDIEAMQRAGVWWCYFSSWNRTLNKSPLETLIRTYQSPGVITVGSPEDDRRQSPPGVPMKQPVKQ